MATKAKTKEINIEPPKFETVSFTIVGTAPLVQHKFSKSSMEKMIEAQEAGDRNKNKRKREPKDFDKLFNAARFVSPEGWDGINAAAVRNSMISACRVAGFVMTRAKLTIFVEADGFDSETFTPLVRITKGTAERFDAQVRLEKGGTDIRPRPMYAPGWEAVLRIRYDSDQFSSEDIANLLMRSGQQCGLGEGRPDSKKSNGMGWGLFTFKPESESKEAA